MAMITEVPYQDIRNMAVEWFGFDPIGPFYTTVYDLRDLLAEYGYSLSRNTPFTTYKTISPLSLLELHRPGNYSHWVLSVKCGLDRYILDPAPHIKTDQRRDWWRIKVINYANVRKLPEKT
ncbi:hypothetical protein [Pseudodesulfovibrio nedwellii]|uniref:hypothetical protein n=1 Tax=Pseudodesulfovibrio nedwellii TaxID=2973072 RepID=UPI0024905B75|nr:hypothetical protein [Pseudodesulfovibrio nedwellii]